MRPISQRKANGVFYTPTPIADYIVARTLELLPKNCLPRVLDPACGDGVFLQAASEHLLSQSAWRSARARTEPLQLIQQSIYGVDRDPAAIAAARERLAGAWPDLAVPNHNLRAADALTEDIFEAEGFDAIVGNPPYVNVRILARTYGQDMKRVLAERYACARGAYDLYVLFMERAFELLRPGGVCGLIVPNKIATLDYALPCRKLLLEQTSLHQVTDVTELRAFGDAGVYPYILVWQKKKPTTTHSVPVLIAESLDELRENKTTRHVRQSSLVPRGFAFHGTLDVEQRVATVPFGSLASLHSGTTGFSAGRVAAELCEADQATAGRCFDFIVSGNIDPYVIRHGDVRYMKRRYQRPVLAVDSDCLSDAKRHLFSDRKIVIAGMTKRLEAAYDAQGLALGVQVYAAARFQEDAFYLLGLLNSKLLSHLFRLRFQAKRLAGGYLAINKNQLAQLPIRAVTADDKVGRATRSKIIRVVQKIANAAPSFSPATLTAAMREVDTLVYALYELTAPDIEQIEATTPDFASRSAAA
jgi:SAM-dependent methyltransferase